MTTVPSIDLERKHMHEVAQAFTKTSQHALWFGRLRFLDGRFGLESLSRPGFTFHITTGPFSSGASRVTNR